MKIKTTYVIGLFLIIAIIVSGYFLYQQQLQLPQPQVTQFEQYAENLGLDLQQFSSCLDSRKYKGEVQNDFNDGRLYGVDGTPTFFVNGRLLVGAVPFEQFKAAIDQELTSMSNPQIEVRTGSNPPRGNESAVVTIVEFSDFQCPFCGRVQPTVEQVLQQYEGKVKLYFRDFPLTSIHPYSQQAAEASRCAGEQGKFWEYHDVLFEKQSEWSSG